MLFKSLVTASLAAVAFAQPLQGHQHHAHKEEKRDVVVVTKVNTVEVTLGAGDLTTVLPQVTLSTPTTVSLSTPATVAPQHQPLDFTNPSTFQTSTTSGSAPSLAPSSGSSSGSKGVTYSPYSDNGGCKSQLQISSEVAQLGGYDVLRIYGVDCNQVAALMQAKASHQKLFVGIFDVSNIESGIQTLADGVNGNWDGIHTVSIGNELVNSGQASVSQVAQYVKTARSALKSAGYSGPVVAVDTFIAVINNPGLCDISDYMAVNAHAFFDGHVTADQAGDWVLLQIQRVYSACQNKSVFITESGWPSQGESNGLCVPSKENQQSAVSSIQSKAGNDVILHSAFNEMWKAPGAFNAEQYWGINSN